MFLGLSGGPQVAVVVDRAWRGEVFEHFAGDGAFEQAQISFLERPAASWRAT